MARCPSAEHVWDPLVAVRMPIWILGLDERLLLSIRAVSSTERPSLITSNIISHKEFQATSRASERRQRHIKWGLAREPKMAGRLGASHAENCDFSEKKKKKSARQFGCETAEWEEMKESECITVKSHWVWLLPSTQPKYPSFDSWCITLPLSRDFDMTEQSLVMEPIKDLIFCLSDISMSKLFAGKLCFTALAGWPPTRITMGPQWCLLQMNRCCKSWCGDFYHTPSYIYTLPQSEFPARHHHKPCCYMFCLRLLYYWPLTIAGVNSHEVQELADAVAFLQGPSAPTHTQTYLYSSRMETSP